MFSVIPKEKWQSGSGQETVSDSDFVVLHTCFVDGGTAVKKNVSYTFFEFPTSTHHMSFT